MKQEVYEEQALELLGLMQTERDFEVGDFVTWKDARLRKTKLPEPGGRVLVTEVFDPIRNTFATPGSQYFCDLIDFRFIIYDDDSDWIEFASSSKYFKKA